MLNNIRISEDGSKVFCLEICAIQTLSIQTGKLVSKVKVAVGIDRHFPAMNGLQSWVSSTDSKSQGVRICDPTTQSRSRAEPDISVRCPSICFPLFPAGFCIASGLIPLVLSHPSLFPLIFLYVRLTYPDFPQIPISSVSSLFPLSSI